MPTKPGHIALCSLSDDGLLAELEFDDDGKAVDVMVGKRNKRMGGF